MDYYGPADQGALPGALAFLYERRDALLRPGASHRILHHGGIIYNAPRVGPQIIRKKAAPAMRIYPPAGGGPEAHLPFGFRAERTIDERPPHMSFLGADEPVRGVPTLSAHVVTHPMRPGRHVVSRDGFDEFGREVFVDGMASPIWAYEDRACLEELSRLPRHGLELGHGVASLASLWDFVEKGMNPKTSAFMRFDTVFIGNGMFARLDDVAGGPARAAPNLVEHLGMRVLSHARIPDGVAYVTSHTHGPVFVNGPTDISCMDDAFVVDRYCEVIGPRPVRQGERPRGFCVGVSEAA